jgi:methylenetetrahydrofolate dehydrogenase (NADP+)/methenyltetrahydrofolate cyclohydrolase
MKQKKAEQIGIDTEFIDIADMSFAEQKKYVSSLNQDKGVGAIIIQLPLKGIDNPQELLDCIGRSKDVDGLSSASQHSLEANAQGFVPATPLAVMELLQHEGIDLSGKKVTVLGRSKLVGKPLEIILKQAGAKVVVGHSRTADLQSLTLGAEIIISAVGKPNLVTQEMISNGSIIIDVGITKLEGRLVGDVDFDGVKNKASLITPVPGGVGPMTVIMLLQNVVKAYS